MTQALNWLVRKTSDLEANIVAMERTKEYSDLPNEVCMLLTSAYLHTEISSLVASCHAHIYKVVTSFTTPWICNVLQLLHNLSFMEVCAACGQLCTRSLVITRLCTVCNDNTTL